jgi:hypothetical protein
MLQSVAGCYPTQIRKYRALFADSFFLPPLRAPPDPPPPSPPVPVPANRGWARDECGCYRRAK